MMLLNIVITINVQRCLVSLTTKQEIESDAIVFGSGVEAMTRMKKG